MAAARKKFRNLRAQDFAGDGEPYTEVSVRISIRVLGKQITRSRMAVSIYPDQALKSMAQSRMEERGSKNFGHDDHGNFIVCLGNDLNGYEDLNCGYPRIAQEANDEFQRERLREMDAYIRDSADFVLSLHRDAMKQVAADTGQKGLVM